MLYKLFLDDERLPIGEDWNSNYQDYNLKKDFDIKWAEKYSVSNDTIRHIRNNKTWKDVII